jgi:hypothetical protein
MRDANTVQERRQALVELEDVCWRLEETERERD